MVFRIVSGLVIAYALIFIVLLASAALISKGTMPESMMKGIVLLACFIGGLTGAVFAIRGYSGRRFIFSAGMGGLIILLMFLTGTLLTGNKGFAGGFLLNAVAVLAGPLIVGLGGRKKAFKKR
jgi:putative membrane protein (TIGR04086 family)